MKLPKYIRHNKTTMYGRLCSKPYKGEFYHKNTYYYCGMFETVRQAQIAVDRKRLELGLDTVILKPAKKN